ncbi:hypothetical protein COU60_00310 [Candidatus Pacearchaeota archaeon CG10_big_fil_rev_8_21_14_0_10_34_76]|nr:MAG: hypothetical protein COU60_00310 [Candidatus Pacearchaeota archaeon CG10_big_fil_rev_8_21_14_0_10_34_76]
MESRKKVIVGFEVFLLVSFSVAFAYLIYQENKSVLLPYVDEGKFIGKTRAVILDHLGKNLVSAQEAMNTCTVDINGRFCQEYIASECEEKCDVANEGRCLPSRAEETSLCKLGTCITGDGLSCNPNTPKLRCDDIGGTWDERGAGEIPQCQKGCCFIGSENNFVTSAQCNSLSSSSGIILDGENNRFDPGIRSELQCLLLANPSSEGACVLSSNIPEENDCQFTIKSSCNTLGGDFYEGKLCSNSEINTICEKQSTTGIVDGKDEIYWFDSCGNKENIYEGGSGVARQRSWNNGSILSKAESCILGDERNPLKNQASCGNCNYLDGTKAGLAQSGDTKNSDGGNYVCRDIRCSYTDQFGKRVTRENGEAWCSYESQIGTEGEGNEQRGLDVPGSSHYKNVCLNGEVRIEQCASGRQQICSESRDEEIGFSSAACRPNQWARCFALNQEGSDLSRCEDITDCTLRNIDLTKGGNDNFKFSLCVPKYPPGFDLKPDLDVFGQISGEVRSDAEIACGLASLKCTEVSVGGLGGTKRTNDLCHDKVFTETLNNLCMSLGDCGGGANIVGEYTDDGYSVNFEDIDLQQNYISALRKVARAVEGQRGEPLSADEIASFYNVNTGSADYKPEDAQLALIGTVGGLAGITLAYAVQAGWISGAGSVAGGAESIAAGAAEFAGPEAADAFLAEHAGPGLGAYAGAAAGALIGAATVSLLLKYTGVGAGLSKEIQYALIAGGAIAGAIAGWSLVGGTGAFAAGFSWVPVVGWVLGILVIGFIGLGWLLGWGKKKEKEVVFTCKPWVPPSGGADCGKCGDNGLPCNEYKCESLGTACEFLNEGTDAEICVAVEDKDAGPPIIKSDRDPLTEGFDYTQESNLGFNVIGNTSDGCLPAYTPVKFGIEITEAGQCKYDIVQGKDFETMSYDFGGNLFRMNHVMSVFMPALSALQEEGINQDVRADFNLFVRCKDRAGNANEVDYNVRFCVSPEDDLTPPIISRFSPANGGFTAFGATERNVNFFVNEPSDCRWDSQDVDYDVMLNEVNCEQSAGSTTLLGYRCEVNVPVNSDLEENKYYLRCKDQPYLEISNPDGKTRNKNTQSVEYILKKSNELKIVSISPGNDETITTGNVEYVGIELSVQTEGGAEGARRVCEYDSANNGLFDEFFETGGDIHKQNMNLIFRDYEIPIKCVDDAGNKAEGISKFTIDIDNIGPIITRFYKQDNELKVITHENSVCAFSNLGRDFEFVNGTLMNGNEIAHSTSFENSFTYYVKCKDGFENIGGSVVIREGFF